MDKYFDEFMNMYHSNMIENKNSMRAIKGRLITNYKENNNTPIVALHYTSRYYETFIVRFD